MLLLQLSPSLFPHALAVAKINKVVKAATKPGARAEEIWGFNTVWFYPSPAARATHGNALPASFAVKMALSANVGPKWSEVYLALGANLGDRLNNLQEACRLLEAANLPVQARSPVFETDAVADTPQPAYLNAALRVKCGLAPEELLMLTMSIERTLGRQRNLEGRWSPRSIDIDILLFADVICSSPSLTLPHPRLLERAFVRIPLAAVAQPTLRHPITGDRLDEAQAHPGVRLWPETL